MDIKEGRLNLVDETDLEELDEFDEDVFEGLSSMN